MIQLDTERGELIRHQVQRRTRVPRLERVAGIERLVFTGDAVNNSVEIIERFRQSQATACEWPVNEDSPFLAEAIARLACFKEPVKPEDLQACYVRPPDIKLKPQVQ